MDKEIIVSLKDISKTFRIKDRKTNTIRSSIFHFLKPNKSRSILALDNINFEVYKGETIGIIGKNGSGKSTLLKIISEVYPPDKGGKVNIKGNFQKLSLGTGFDLELTTRENIYLNASLFGLSFKKIGQIFQQIIDFSELNEFVDTKVKYFSDGMLSRLAFSIAINVDADIYLMDEFGVVGDLSFRKKSEAIFEATFMQEKTIIYISHDLDKIKAYCNRVLLIHNGKLIMIGSAEEVINTYKKDIY